MVGKKLDEILNELKITPEEFGLHIGVGKSSIYKILRGDIKKITKNFAKKVNKKFPQYSVDYLLSLNYEVFCEDIEATEEEKLTEDEIKIVSKVVLLKEKQILKVPFFNKWLKEKKLEAKLEVYKELEALKNKS